MSFHAAIIQSGGDDRGSPPAPALTAFYSSAPAAPTVR